MDDRLYGNIGHDGKPRKALKSLFGGAGGGREIKEFCVLVCFLPVLVPAFCVMLPSVCGCNIRR